MTTSRLLSCKRLGDLLKAHGFVAGDAPFSARARPAGWSDETYGRESFLYWSCPRDVRERVIPVLRQAGVPLNLAWNNGQGLELRVAYFKSWHWNE